MTLTSLNLFAENFDTKILKAGSKIEGVVIDGTGKEENVNKTTEKNIFLVDRKAINYYNGIEKKFDNCKQDRDDCEKSQIKKSNVWKTVVIIGGVFALGYASAKLEEKL